MNSILKNSWQITAIGILFLFIGCLSIPNGKYKADNGFEMIVSDERIKIVDTENGKKFTYKEFLRNDLSYAIDDDARARKNKFKAFNDGVLWIQYPMGLFKEQQFYFKRVKK